MILFPRTPPSQACAAGCPSSTLTSAALGAKRCQQPFDMRGGGLTLPTQPLRRAPTGIKPVRAGHGQQPGARHILAQLLERLLRLRRHRALIQDGDLLALLRRHHPMRTRNHMRRIQRPLGLRQNLRRKPQPHRRAIRLLHMLEGMAQQNRQLVAIGRLETRQPVLHDRQQRRVGRLMLPALGRQA